MVKKLLSIFLLCSSVVIAQNGLDFDGVDDVVTTTYFGISGSNARTVEAWIKTTANANPANGGSQKTIVDWGNLATGQRFTFNLLWGNAIRLEAQGNGLSGNTAVNDGNWHHVAAVYDPNATNKVSLYVDGVLDVAGNLTVTINTNLVTPVRIGRRIDGVNGFTGAIDEVRIWNIAKTQTQIQESMNFELCSPQPNLMAYYKFNEGIADGTNTSTTSVPDFSGNNNNGTLNGFALTGSTSNWVNGASLPQQTLDNTVTNPVAGTLVANLSGATYQWIDCNNSNLPISGATSQTFSTTNAGFYAVIISKNGCTATSDCTLNAPLNISGINFKNTVKLYPNPSKEITNIQLNQSFDSIEATVYNVTGQRVLKKEFNKTNSFSLNINGSSGIYFLDIKTNSGENAVIKVVKE